MYIYPVAMRVLQLNVTLLFICSAPTHLFQYVFVLLVVYHEEGTGDSSSLPQLSEKGLLKHDSSRFLDNFLRKLHVHLHHHFLIISICYILLHIYSPVTAQSPTAFSTCSTNQGTQHVGTFWNVLLRSLSLCTK